MDGFVSNECRRRRFLLAEEIAAAAATPIGPLDKFITPTLAQQLTAVLQLLATFATMMKKNKVRLYYSAL